MSKAAVSDPLRGPRDEPDDIKLSAKLDEIVAEMIAAAPSLHPQRARRWLLRTESGRALLAQHSTNKKEQPMDMQKLVSVMEEALLARAPNPKDFAKLYETDLSFRKQWATVTEAKQMLALSKGMATLTPTSTGVGNTNVSDDSAEAVRQLQQMCEKQGRSFDQVFADPANSALAQKTYTSAHRSSINTDYLEL